MCPDEEKPLFDDISEYSKGWKEGFDAGRKAGKSEGIQENKHKAVKLVEQCLVADKSLQKLIEAIKEL